MKERLENCLIKQGVWEHEVEEVLADFTGEVKESDLKIVTIYDSFYDLGEDYFNNHVFELDHHVKAMIDFSELGEHLSDKCEEYLALSTGRIIMFV